MTSGGKGCLQILYIFVLREGEKTFQGKVVKNFARNTIGSPKIDVESFILMIEHILFSILLNLTRATLLSLRNHINITII